MSIHFSKKFEVEDADKELSIDYENGEFYVYEDWDGPVIGTFGKDGYSEAVGYCKKIKGKVIVHCGNCTGNIFLIDGEVVWFETEWGMGDDFVREKWLGIVECDEEEEGSVRYSIYDVYSEKELL